MTYPPCIRRYLLIQSVCGLFFHQLFMPAIKSPKISFPVWCWGGVDEKWAGTRFGRWKDVAPVMLCSPSCLDAMRPRPRQVYQLLFVAWPQPLDVPNPRVSSEALIHGLMPGLISDLLLTLQLPAAMVQCLLPKLLPLYQDLILIINFLFHNTHSGSASLIYSYQILISAFPARP